MEARIYVGTYAKYNSGSLGGKWLDLDDYSDVDELYEAMAELHSDEEDPEYMIQDVECEYTAMCRLLNECGESEFRTYYEVKDAVDDYDVYFAYVEALGVSVGEDLGKYQDAHYGEFDSDADFAEEYAEMCGYMDKDVKWPFNCIDWEQAARELMHDFNSHDGHYFLNH